MNFLSVLPITEANVLKIWDCRNAKRLAILMVHFQLQCFLHKTRLIDGISCCAITYWMTQYITVGTAIVKRT